MTEMEKLSVRLATEGDMRFMEGVIEKYLHEMSPFADIELDEEGNYSYPLLSSYFRKSGRSPRRLYIIEVGRSRVGFMMVCRGVSPDGQLALPSQAIDWCVAEFTVFPRFRRQGIGRDAFELVVADNPGRWGLMYDDRNLPAARLWSSVCDDHEGKIRNLGEHSRILTFEI